MRLILSRFETKAVLSYAIFIENEECELYVGGEELGITGYINDPQATEKSVVFARNAFALSSHNCSILIQQF